MSNLVVVKLTDAKKPADGGVIVAVCRDMAEAQQARMVPACGVGRAVLDSSLLIWKGHVNAKIGDKVSMYQYVKSVESA